VNLSDNVNPTANICGSALILTGYGVEYILQEPLMIDIPKGVNSSFVNPQKLQAEYEDRKSKEESASSTGATSPTVNVPGAATAPANDPQLQIPPLTSEEADEIISSVTNRQYFKDYCLFGNSIYTIRLWTSKEEEEHKILRAKKKLSLESQFKNDLLKLLDDEAKKYVNAYSTPLSTDILLMIEDAMTSFDTRYLLSRCIVKIDGKVLMPEECSLLLDSMPSEQVSVLAMVLNEHRTRYSNLALRSIEDQNIKKSLASRQSSMNSQGQPR
jgi:hypothetical protein